MHRTKLYLAVSTFAAVSTLAGNAAAQMLEEVTVTATKRSASIQDIPFNISAVSGDTIREMGIADITDLSKVVPGLVVSDQGIRTGFITSAISIRGMNAELVSRGSGPLKTVSPVAVYVNESPLFVNFQFQDLERVEVLRGPQGTLYGSGAMGGAIRYITNKPDTQEFQARVDTTVGSTAGAGDLNHKIHATLNIPLSDTFAVRMNAGLTKNAGFIDAPSLYQVNKNEEPVLADPDDILGSLVATYSKSDINDEEARSFRIAARWEPNDAVVVDLHYMHQKLEADATMEESLSLPQGNKVSPRQRLNGFEGETDFFSVEVQADVGFATATYAGTYSDDKNELGQDNTGLYEMFSFWTAYYGDGPRPYIPVFEKKNKEATVHELRLTSNSDGALNWIVGGFYMEEETDAATEQWYPGYTDYSNACFPVHGFASAECGYGTLTGVYEENGGLPIRKDLAYLTNFQEEFTDMALFGEVGYNFTDLWQVTAGVRFYDQEIDIKEQAGLMFVPGGIANESGSISETGQLYKLNTSYHLNDDTQIYANWSEGFRRGGSNGLPQTVFGAPVDDDLRRFAPDFATSYDIGIKGSISGRTEYSVALFRIDWEDIQLNTSCTPVGILCALNAGEARNQGLEAEVRSQITDSLMINAGYTYIDSEITNTTGANGGFGGVKGESLPGVPEHSGSVSLIYQHTLDNGLEFSWNGVVSYTGKRLNGLDGATYTELDSYTNIDTALSLTGEQWTVGLRADNLLDNDEYIGVMPAGEVGQSNATGHDASGLMPRPRTISVLVNYHF
ncbi:MAG: TonB-dependent receptor [Pseudomonadales bacterium]